MAIVVISVRDCYLHSLKHTRCGLLKKSSKTASKKAKQQQNLKPHQLLVYSCLLHISSNSSNESLFILKIGVKISVVCDGGRRRLNVWLLIAEREIFESADILHSILERRHFEMFQSALE